MNTSGCKYNYIFYGASNGFVELMMGEYNDMDNAALMEDPFVSNNKFLKCLYKAHTYAYTNKYFEIPFKGIWNRHCSIPEKFDARPICFVFFPKYTTNKELHKYLRKTYPGCKLVLQFWNLVSRNIGWFPNLDLDYIKKEFDLVLSFDKNDCITYGLQYYDAQTPRKQNLKMSTDKYESDVVFIGRGKNRNEKVNEIYDMLTEAGFSCYFVIVEKERKLYTDNGIIYTNKLMPYGEILQHVVDSRCVLEIVQDGQYGFSCRSKEALIYNKKLITNNKIIKDQRFYPSKDICFFEKSDDINLDMLRDYTAVDHKYKDDYSNEKVIELIESIL